MDFCAGLLMSRRSSKYPNWFDSVALFKVPFQQLLLSCTVQNLCCNAFNDFLAVHNLCCIAFNLNFCAGLLMSRSISKYPNWFDSVALLKVTVSATNFELCSTQSLYLCCIVVNLNFCAGLLMSQSISKYPNWFDSVSLYKVPILQLILSRTV